MIIAIHGGAGNILPQNYSDAQQKEHLTTLEKALELGYNKLLEGAPAMQAVLSAITFLEDVPIFNAGRGSVFSSKGLNEMDASIMCGKTLNAGAITSVTTIKNPILAAHKVMDGSEHVLLSGVGAEEFAQLQGLEIVENQYFFNQVRYEQWQQMNKSENAQLEHDAKKYGTVGAVALDSNGNIAAGTSTGGLTNKKFNRIGDSPIIGAGTYANNSTCAVSCTGYGEYFMRNLTAYDIHCLIEYKNFSLEQAAKAAIEKVGNLGGTGGVICIDKSQNFSFQFNSTGMFRGIQNAQRKQVLMFA